MSDSGEEYEGDEIPSENESVDGNDISDDEDFDLNVGSGRHSANYSRRFEDTQDLSDEIWSNKSLPFSELPFTQNVGPKNIPDTVKTPMGVKRLPSYRDYWSSNPQLNDAYISRNTMKQYMPQKPIKRGYKVWVRSDMNGYVCEFQMYTGKIGNAAEKNLLERVIKDLSQTLIKYS
ncbi:hypothetical protein ALC57_09044 [Trachymyrmex cornetzi]|uniref:PiggyBac transposable element-derived protein domain-containing protein n=1 Tax=Trachymyrmex cornetzi TaxID=471704 RepID=A0A151J602_9HYME|nr:hypothetical protein ALC57_09044 [Trachymyrmex cornetzi]